MDEHLDRMARAFLDSKSEREKARLVAHRGTPKREKRQRRFKSNRYWQEWEIEVLGKFPDREAAQKTGRTLLAVSTKRVELKIPAIRTRQLPWTSEQIALLGELPDDEVARRIGCTYGNVSRKRLELGIHYVAQKMNYWTVDEDRLWARCPMRRWREGSVANAPPCSSGRRTCIAG
jgi:hypothetical protein